MYMQTSEMTCLPVSQLLSQAEALLANFEQDGETSYIDEAIDLDRKALQLCLPGDNKRSVALALLAPHVHAPDEQLGITKDLDEAIVFGREALIPPNRGHPIAPSL